jgi:hypothetical protein
LGQHARGDEAVHQAVRIPAETLQNHPKERTDSDS